MPGAGQTLAAFLTPFFFFLRHSWEESWVGMEGLIPRGLVALAIGSVYWAVQNRGWFGNWAQGPSNWSKFLVVHMVVNGTPSEELV